MNRAKFLFLIIFAGWIAFSPGKLIAADSPTDAKDSASEKMRFAFDVDFQSQLFVDRGLVRDTSRVWFTQHQGKKYPNNPLLKADQPWEGWRIYVYGNVIYDKQERIFKMWYGCDQGGTGHGDKLKVNEFFEKANSARQYMTCYATSEDGIHWEKPLVGTVPSKYGKPHNVVVEATSATVLKDLNETDSSKRYKMLAHSKRCGNLYCCFASPDGLDWTHLKETCNSEALSSLTGDYITAFWDHRRNLYVAFAKHKVDWDGKTRRLGCTLTSKDFIQWTTPKLAWKSDSRDDIGAFGRLERLNVPLDAPLEKRTIHTAFYPVGAYPAESCTIAFPTVMTVSGYARWGNHEGGLEIQLAVSRDLYNWERPFRTPLIEPGKPGEWDCGMHTPASYAIDVGDEVWLYYGGSNHSHGSPALRRTFFEDGKPTGRGSKYTSAIGLVTWKRDRFVSVDGPSEGGSLTTIPIAFRGSRLEINASTKPNGHIKVELLDTTGRPLKDWPISDPIRGDSLRHLVKFNGSADLSALTDKAISLRFHITSGSLFGFTCRP